MTYPERRPDVTIYQFIEKDAARAIEDDKKSNARHGCVPATGSTDKKDSRRRSTNEMDFATGDADKISYVFDHAGLTAQ